MNDINDIRGEKEFKHISFSGYKKAKVSKELINNMLNGKIENSCYWSAELICAGHFLEVWESIILFMSKHIHLANVKLPLYLDMRFRDFKKTLQGGYSNDELRMRNNSKIRMLFAEVISVLCLSNKKYTTERVRVDKTDFDMTNMTTRLRAKTTDYAQGIFQMGDPKELFIAVNEFAYHLSKESRNIRQACYWIEWIMQFESICKTKKEKCTIARRSFAPVQDKFQTSVVWIAWDCLLTESAKRDALLHKTVKALLNIYSIRFSDGVKRRRMSTVYFAISLLTEPLDINKELVPDKSLLPAIKSKIEAIYKEVKKNEKAPKNGIFIKT